MPVKTPIRIWTTLLMSIAISALSAQESSFNITTIHTGLTGISTIDFADVDRDGDMDICWGSEQTPTAKPTGLHWLENTGDDFTKWISHSIDSSILAVMSLQVVDLNKDGLPDILASAWATHEVSWYENRGGKAGSWIKHVLLTDFYFAHDAFAACVDEDDLPDIVAAGAYKGEIRILYNTGTDKSPQFNDQYSLCMDYKGVRTAISHDFNQDGRADILAASTQSDKLWLWYNKGGKTSWERKLIDEGIPGFHNFSLTDFDRDGDTDFFATGRNMLALYINEGGTAPEWKRNILDQKLEIASRVLAADFDLDQDIDAFLMSKIPGKVNYYRNLGKQTETWEKHELIESFQGAWGCRYIDFDQDGDLDIFACAGAENTLIYLQNTSVQK